MISSVLNPLGTLNFCKTFSKSLLSLSCNNSFSSIRQFSTAVHNRAIYLKDSHLFSHISLITAMGKSQLKGKEVHWVRLKETIFHPQGGGQSSDSGSINGYKVDFVLKEKNADQLDFEVSHCFYGQTSFSIGQSVELQIDEKIRRHHMRLHSAGHLIANIIETHFPQIKAIAAHHVPGQARVSFASSIKPEKKTLTQDLIVESSKLIQSRTPVQLFFSEKNERTVQIGKFKAIPCGGTHVHNLDEIGKILIRNVKTDQLGFQVGYDITD